MTDEQATFGASFGSIFLDGVRGYFRNLPALSLAAAATLGTFLVFRMPAQEAWVDGNVVRSIGLDLVGLMLGSVVAFPWYCYALDAIDGKPIDMGRPFRDWNLLYSQLVASFWFWAAVFLGLRYLFGIPSILAALFYAFYGFAIADGAADGGLKALGVSVKIGDGKRIGLFAIALIFLIFNVFGAIALGYEVTALTIGLAVAGMVVTTSITMVAGARIYRLLQQGVVR